MIEIKEVKEVKEEDVLSIKENHVLSCFTDYLYHKHASDLIQEELVNIAAELSSGSTSTSIIRVSKDKGSCTPWENELLAREHELIQERISMKRLWRSYISGLQKLKIQITRISLWSI